MASPVVTPSNLISPFWMSAKFTPSAAANVTGSVVPTAKILQGGTVGAAYSETISAQGGAAPYSFAVTAGSLPAGLTLGASSGVISGTPAAVATSDFTIKATDANGLAGSTDFEISVTAPGAGSATNYCIID